jgi:hypothetical protein
MQVSNNQPIRIVLSIVAVICLLAQFERPGQAYEFSTVILTGNEPAGFAGRTVTNVGLGQINNAGQVYYTARISGFDSAHDSVLYAGLPATPGLLVQEGGQAPGFPVGANFGGGFSNPTAISLAGDGRLVFGMSLASNAGLGINSSNDTFSWIAMAGDVVPILREGDAAPGLDGRTIDQVNASAGVYLTDTGRIYQRQATLSSGAAAGNVVFAGTTPANLAPYLREGDVAPDATAGEIINQLSNISPKGDHLVVSGSLVQGQGGVTAANDFVIWSTDGGGDLRISLREGDEVGGLVSPGTTVSQFGATRINSSGTIIGENFNLLADGLHATSSNDRVLLIGSANEQFTVYAREGSPVPGLPGVMYGNNLGDSRIADNGQVLINPVLAGAVTADDDLALLTGTPDNLHVVARKGDQAPGFVPGVKLQGWSSSGYNMNNSGSIALITNVSDGLGFTSEGIFVTDPASGLLELLVKRGDMLEVAPGDSREISDLSVGLGTSSRNYNDHFQLYFSASFTDGSSGLFIAQVPEPASCQLVALGIVALFARRPSR